MMQKTKMRMKTMNKKKFLQTKGDWAGLGYPKAPWYIRNCGCGEVSIANIIVEMQKYAKYTPKTIQPFCKQYAAPNGDGTYLSGIPKMMKHYGLKEVKEHDTMPSLFKELAKGDRVAMLLMGSRDGGSKKVHWSSGGHFVVALDYKKENGKDYLYIEDSYSNSKLRNGWITYQGNLKGDCVMVWSGKLTGALYDSEPVQKGKLKVDGVGGKKTVTAMQKFLGAKEDGIITGQNKKQEKYYPALHAVKFSKNGSSPTVKLLQKWLGLTEDGEIGKGTVAAWQHKLKEAGYYTHKIDGVFGVQSMKALQKYLNDHDKADFPKKETTKAPTLAASASKKQTKANKIVAEAKKFCWPYGTKKSKWKYKTGRAKSVYKKALKKFMKHSAKISQSDCGYFVATCVRAAGVSKTFKALPGSAKQNYPKVPKTMKIVHKGKKIPKGLLRAGDIIRYRKSGGGQHTLMYIGGGKIAEAQRGHAFPAIKKDTKKYNKANVKKKTIQVLRAK